MVTAAIGTPNTSSQRTRLQEALRVVSAAPLGRSGPAPWLQGTDARLTPLRVPQKPAESSARLGYKQQQQDIPDRSGWSELRNI